MFQNILRTDEIQGYCRLCKKPVFSKKYYFRIPPIDPCDTHYPREIAELIGASCHLWCWSNHAYFEGFRVALLKTLSSEFGSENQIYTHKHVALWIVINPYAQHGALLLARSAYLFQNIMGLGFKGAIFRGRRIGLESFIHFVINHKLDIRVMDTVNKIPQFECIDIDDEYIWIAVYNEHMCGEIIMLNKLDLAELKECNLAGKLLNK